MGGLAGDKAIRARINSFLQVAAARTADFGQAGDGAAAIHVPHAAVQRVRAEAGQLLHRSGFHRADTAAILGEIAAALPLHTQKIRQRIIDAAGGCIQIGVHADGRDVVFDEQRRHIPCADMLERVKDHRVVADDQLAVVLHCLLHHRRRDVQCGQHVADRHTDIHQQAHIVPAASQLRRGQRLQQPENLLHRYRHDNSSICLMSTSTASASCPAGRPRRYFFSLAFCWA